MSNDAICLSVIGALVIGLLIIGFTVGLALGGIIA